MPYKNFLHDVHTEQLKTFVTCNDFKKKYHLLKNEAGLYWIWTSKSMVNLEDITTISPSEIPIGELVKRRKNLNYICNVHGKYNDVDYRIIYNGKSTSLRRRILQELRGPSSRTGTLHANRIGTDYIGITYITESVINSLLTKHSISPILFRSPYFEDIERDWRLEFGTPICVRN